MSLKLKPSQLKTARNQLRTSRTRRQVVGSAFVGPLQRNQRRAPRLPCPIASFSETRIEAPVASSVVMRGNSSTSSAAMPFPLRRKEYVTDVAGSVAFAVTKFSVNPGIQATFPWAGGISPSFEEYDTASIAFHYEPESSSSATGTVIISFDYDAADLSPTTKQQMLTFADNVRSAPWVPCTLVLKVSDLRKRGRLYVRTGPVASTDIKTYDLGNVYVATSGQANANTIGEFWISYNFPHHTPTPNPQLSTLHITGVTPTTASLLGTQTVVSGPSIATLVANILTFNVAGKFSVVYDFLGTSSTFGSVTVSATGSLITTYIGNSGVTGESFGGSASTAFIEVVFLNAVVGTTLTFANTVVSGTTGELVVFTLPPGFL
jgi:hypothetical protein